MFAYVGCYTTPDRDGRGDGIRVYHVNDAGDHWTEIQTVAGLENPSLFTLRRDRSILYSVHGGRNLISALSVDHVSGKLTLLNQMECQGNNPVDCALDPSERFLVIGNYGTGTVAVMPLAADGRLEPVSQLFTLTGTPGPDPVQQSSSHPHAVIFDPSGEFVVVPDKGFDKTFLFRFASGAIAPTEQASIASKPGAAPRHTTFHPSLPILYVNNELDSTVTVFNWTAGRATECQVTSTIPGGYEGRNTTAEIVASPVRALSVRVEPRPGQCRVVPGLPRHRPPDLWWTHTDRRTSPAILHVGPGRRTALCRQSGQRRHHRISYRFSKRLADAHGRGGADRQPVSDQFCRLRLNDV